MIILGIWKTSVLFTIDGILYKIECMSKTSKAIKIQGSVGILAGAAIKILEIIKK